MTQIARNAVEETSGCVRACRYLLQDRDSEFCASFQDVLRSEGLSCLALPPPSPNLNAFADGPHPSFSARRIPVSFLGLGDVWTPAWSSGGRIAGIGAPFASSILALTH
jgi:hypothetical protein